MARSRFVAPAAACALAICGAAQGNVFWSFTNGSNYNWRVTYMPDFDQKRDSGGGVVGLPNDGNMYCVPTATLNIAAYVARHGYPFVNPGPIYFPANNTQYNTVTSNLTVLGILMGTSPTDGTGGNGWFAGAKAWFNPLFFDVQFKYASGGWSPKTWNLFQYGQWGGLTTFAYGRYEHSGSVLTARTGGHAVTTSKIEVVGGQKKITFRNPSSSDSLFSQSPYVHQEHAISEQVWITGNGIRTMTELITDSTDGRVRLIDGVVIVYPRFGMTNNDPNTITLNFPLVIHNPNIDPPPLHFNFAGALVDFEMDPLGEHLAAIFRTAEGPSAMVGVIPQTMEQIPLATLFDPGPMTISPNGLIYCIDRRDIVCIDPYEEEIDPIRIPLPPNLDPKAIACNDMMDQVVVLCDGSVLVAYPWDLQGEPEQGFLLGPDLVGDVDLDFAPDGSLWACGTEGDVVQQHVIDPASGRWLPAVQIQGDEVRAPRSIQVDSMGDVFFVSDGLVQHWAPVNRAAEGGEYQPATESIWAGMKAGDRLVMSRGRDNFDPKTMSGPGFNNIDPDGEADIGDDLSDCLADVNFDRRINFQDLNLVVSNFNTNQAWLDGDADGDGDIDFGDLNQVLSNFNSDCP